MYANRWYKKKYPLFGTVICIREKGAFQKGYDTNYLNLKRQIVFFTFGPYKIIRYLRKKIEYQETR